ncbi:cytochrome P450 [Nocardia takedensis]
MTDLASVDFFSDPAIAQNPYEYLEFLRGQNPVYREPNHGSVLVTGYQEAIEVFRDPGTYSSCVAIGGPFPPLPFEPEGDDISDQIEAHRHLFPISEHVVTMDPPQHTRTRGMLSRILTPKRLKENEDFLWVLADNQFDEFLAEGRCEFMGDYAKPFAALAIADLLGVPDEDRAEFRARLAGKGNRVGALDHAPVGVNPLRWLDETFGAYVTERREAPRDDILSILAATTHADGSIPELIEVVRPATLLFAAGQETVTKMLGALVRVLAERPQLRETLREDRGRIAPFMEEALRIECPTKVDFRLTRKRTTLGGVEIAPGTLITLSLDAANRDPRKFDNPHEFDIDRVNAREHLSFGRGIHTCVGAGLARAEGLITINRLLDRVRDLAIDENAHGPAEDRNFQYEPTYLLRGLQRLEITFEPA